MLRYLYRCLLRLHPPYFRRRFSEEMLSIFDQQKGAWAAARLVADGVGSLLRQWWLRPQFWEEPLAQPAPDRVPVFYTIEGFKPRPGWLVDGGLASAVIFTSICLVMGYTWRHPALMPNLSMYRSGSNIFWRPPETAPVPQEAGTIEEQPVLVDGGRVVLVIQMPGQSRIPSENKATGSK